MKENLTMDICFVINNQYAIYAGVCLTSLLENQQTSTQINVHILHSDVTAESQETLKRLEARYSCHIQFYNVQGEDMSHFIMTIPHITVETYYKLFIPKTLKHLDKVLYLDVDVLVLGDLSELWQTDLDDHYAGVVLDLWLLWDGTYLKNLNFDAPYFNAGMMLLNLALLREFSLPERAIAVSCEYGDKIKIQDQDVLNIIFKGRCVLVKPSFNMVNDYFVPYERIAETLNRYYSEVTLEKLEQYQQSPHIVHFAGPAKPWQISCVARHSPAYFTYLHKYQGTSSYLPMPLLYVSKTIFYDL